MSAATRLQVVEGLPKLHTTPRAVVTVASPRVVVEVDDEAERRLRLIFEPFQAVRVTTDDCFELPLGLAVVPQRVSEVLRSLWIRDLQATVRQVDATSAFMSRARHFLIPAQDEFVEVVAWSVTWEPSAGFDALWLDPAPP